MRDDLGQADGITRTPIIVDHIVLASEMSVYDMIWNDERVYFTRNAVE